MHRCGVFCRQFPHDVGGPLGHVGVLGRPDGVPPQVGVVDVVCHGHDEEGGHEGGDQGGGQEKWGHVGEEAQAEEASVKYATYNSISNSRDVE